MFTFHNCGERIRIRKEWNIITVLGSLLACKAFCYRFDPGGESQQYWVGEIFHTCHLLRGTLSRGWGLYAVLTCGVSLTANTQDTCYQTEITTGLRAFALCEAIWKHSWCTVNEFPRPVWTLSVAFWGFRDKNVLKRMKFGRLLADLPHTKSSIERKSRGTLCGGCQAAGTLGVGAFLLKLEWRWFGSSWRN